MPWKYFLDLVSGWIGRSPEFVQKLSEIIQNKIKENRDPTEAEIDALKAVALKSVDDYLEEARRKAEQ